MKNLIFALCIMVLCSCGDDKEYVQIFPTIVEPAEVIIPSYSPPPTPTPKPCRGKKNPHCIGDK